MPDFKWVLVNLYIDEYQEYHALMELAKKLIQESERKGFKIINRRAVNKSSFLDGIKKSAEALGISEAEFLKAVGTDEE